MTNKQIEETGSLLLAAKTRVARVFQYLLAVAQLRNPPKLKLSDYSWSLPLHAIPASDDVELVSVPSDETDYFMRVRRPRSETPCPDPPSDVVEWLEAGWKDPQKDAQFRQFLDDEPFDGNQRRTASATEWMEQRARWQVKELPIRQAGALFAKLFELRNQLERESERFILLLGTGVLHWTTESGRIEHPLLTQPVELEFDPDIPEFTLRESERPPELSIPILRLCPELDGAAISNCKALLEGYPVSPLGGDDTLSLLTGLVQRLWHDGQFVSDHRQAVPRHVPAIQHAPVLYLGTREQGFAAALEGYLEALPQLTDLPESIIRVVGLQRAAPASESSSHDVDLLFTKPANPEQEHVARRLAATGCVLVQGPPGTGKTHTIANLIGHLLAQGKSILVTSHTAKALRVVRDQVVEDLRPLCVSVLEDGAETRKQLETAVHGIVARLSTSDRSLLEREAAQLDQRRRALKSELETARARLLLARQNEYRDLVVGGEGTSPAEAARALQQGAGVQDWIPAPLSPGAALPLTEAEVHELYGLNRELSAEDERDLEGQLPDPGAILSPDELRELFATLTRLEQAPGPDPRHWSHQQQDPELLASLTDRLAAVALPLQNCPPFVLECVEASQSNQEGVWRDLIKLVEDTSRTLGELERTILEQDPRMGPQILAWPIHERLEVSQELAEHVGKGGSLKFFSLLFKPRWKQFLADATVGGRPPSTPAQFSALISLAQQADLQQKLGSRWDRQIAGKGVSTFEQLGPRPERTALQHTARLQEACNWHEHQWQPLLADLRAAGLALELSHPLPELVCTILPETVERQRDVRRRHQLAGRVDKQAEHLDSLPPGELVTRMRRALTQRDAHEYEAVWRRVVELQQRRYRQARKAQLLERVEVAAPGWARDVRARVSPHDEVSPPGPPEKAWRHRQWDEELERRHRDDLDALQQKVTQIQDDLNRTTSQYVERLTWAGQLGRTSVTQQQALIGWLDLMRKIGKGTGKRAARLRSDARRYLAQCRESVPVWIMPLSNVVQNYPPGKCQFDVVILDEASQCDLLGVAALSLGREAIVVGDHEQVSPEAVGQKIEPLEQLINELLLDIPNKELYDFRTSIYDLARQSFGGTVRLREHFRCVPEIIEFSNRLCYDGEIRPLRECSQVQLRPPTVVHRVGNGTYEAGKVNLAEAQEVCALVVAACELPEYAQASVGVISMVGDSQAALIEQLLLQRFDLAEFQRRRILCGNAAQFQGDERDVMFLSMVEASQGTPLPLRADDRFRKRFNVASSRARDQMWVVHSFTPERDLKGEDLRSRLIRHATNPESTQPADAGRAESELERLVLADLAESGYRVHPQWQVGTYRIDMVVEGSASRVAVGCDGDRYHPPEKLPEDMERQAVLERLGWRFIRVRGSEFFREPAAVMERVKRRLEAMGVDRVGQTEAAPTASPTVEKILRRAQELILEWQETGPSAPEPTLEAPPIVRPSTPPKKKASKTYCSSCGAPSAANPCSLCSPFREPPAPVAPPPTDLSVFEECLLRFAGEAERCVPPVDWERAAETLDLYWRLDVPACHALDKAAEAFGTLLEKRGDCLDRAALSQLLAASETLGPRLVELMSHSSSADFALLDGGAWRPSAFSPLRKLIETPLPVSEAIKITGLSELMARSILVKGWGGTLVSIGDLEILVTFSQEPSRDERLQAVLLAHPDGLSVNELQEAHRKAFPWQAAPELVEVLENVEEATLSGDHISVAHEQEEPSPEEPEPDLVDCLVHLLMDIAKADLIVLPVEREAIVNFFREGLGYDDQALERIHRLMVRAESCEFDAHRYDDTLRGVPRAIRELMLEAAATVAFSDGDFHVEERMRLVRYCALLDLTPTFLTSLIDVNSPEVQEDPVALNLARLELTRSDAERVEAAFLELRERYDPQKLASFGTEFLALAEHKLKSVVSAHEALKVVEPTPPESRPSALDALLTAVAREKAPISLATLKTQLKLDGRRLDPADLETLAIHAVQEGRLFQCEGDRLVIPELLSLPNEKAEQLRQAACKYLENPQHQLLYCADNLWKPWHLGISAEQADYALSSSPALQRLSPGKYKLKPKPAVTAPDPFHALQQAGRPHTCLLLAQAWKQSLNQENLDRIRQVLLADSRCIRYPYGLGNWFGLVAWEQEGREKAMRVSWVEACRQFKRALVTDDPNLENRDWEAALVVAREKGDQALAKQIQERLEGKPPPPPPPAEVVLGGTLFATLPPTEDQTWPAFVRLLTLCRRQKPPYSIAELELTPTDVDWLRSWASALSRKSASRWLNSYARLKVEGGANWDEHEAFGLMLLVLFSEVGRREAREGSIWNVLATCFAGPTRSELFLGGQPLALTKQAIEDASRKSNVRHAFGRAGSQQWYLTLFLQFGISYQGLLRLPRWLSLDSTEAIELLSTGPLRSSSFCDMWARLKNFRAGRSYEGATRDALRRTPFVLPEWHDEIIRQARAEVVTGPAAARPTEPGSFLSEPRFRGGLEAPRLEVSVVPSELDLSQSGYDLEVDGEVQGRVLRGRDGSYEAEPARLSLELNRSEIRVTLVGDDGDESHQATLKLLDLNSPLTFYDAEGIRLRLDRESPRPGQHYYVLLNQDLQLEPQPDRIKALPGTPFNLLELPAGWNADLKALRAGQVAWTASFREPTENWSRKVKIFCAEKHPARLGSRVRLFLVGLPAGSTLSWARAAGRELEFVPGDIAGFEAVLEVTAESAQSSIVVQFAARVQGSHYRFERSCELPLLTASRLVDGQWQRCEDLDRLLCREAREDAFRLVSPPPGPRGLPWALVEGDVFSRRPGTGPGPLGELAGYGAALLYRPGPYNSHDPGLCLAREVVNYGRVGIQGLTIAGRSFRLLLRRPLEAGPEHQLVWWTRDNVRVTAGDSLEQSSGTVWEGLLPPGFSEDSPLVVGLAAEGERLGCWWQSQLPAFSGREEPQIAGLLRWFHLPLLGNDFFSSVRTFAVDHPLVCLRAWLMDRSLTVDGHSLAYEAESPEWLSVVRTLLSDWNVEDRDSAREVIDGLKASGEIDERGVFQLLISVSPLLAVRLLRASSRAAGYPMVVRNELLGVDVGANRRIIDQRVTALAAEAAAEMGTDESGTFARRLCERAVRAFNGKETLARLDHLNLGIACNVAPFRKLLAVHLMSDLIDSYGGT